MKGRSIRPRPSLVAVGSYPLEEGRVPAALVLGVALAAPVAVSPTLFLSEYSDGSYAGRRRKPRRQPVAPV